MKARIVEKIALDSPDFVVHLAPLGAWVHAHLHFVHLEYALTGLERRRRSGGDGSNRPVLALPEEHLFAITGNVKRAGVVQYLLGLPGLQLKFVDDNRRWAIG